MPKKRRYFKGKRISKGEKRIAEFLSKYNISFNREQCFEGCLSTKNHPLRFDFFLPDFDLCIEYQGEHHFKPVNKGKRAFVVHKKIVLHDCIKKQYMSNYSTKILEIPYWNFDNIDQILECLFIRN